MSPKVPQVLVVEDERLIARDLQYRLTQLGYAPTDIAASGEAALRSIETVKPDLILMDIILQGTMDGIQVAEAVQARYQIPIIYMTAHADKATMERAQQTRPVAYLTKPYDEQELKQALAQALRTISR